MLHSNPRNLGYNRSTWTLELVSQACQEQGITISKVSRETIRETIVRMGVSWKRAKNWITSPDEKYQLKKSQRKRLIELSQQHPSWVLGFLDEVWWSRLAQPSMHCWRDDKPLRLQQKKLEPEDSAPNALACYGLWCPSYQQMWLRFVEQRPVSESTCQFLAWVVQQLESMGKKVLALIWDNASCISLRKLKIGSKLIMQMRKRLVGFVFLSVVFQ